MGCLVSDWLVPHKEWSPGLCSSPHKKIKISLKINNISVFTDENQKVEKTNLYFLLRYFFQHLKNFEI